jgi:hypothetical protein
MRWTLVPILILAGAVAASAVVLEDDFESTAIGALPAGWGVVTPWGDWAPGPVTAEVAASPTGGQALMFVLGTDWGSYGASSGEVQTPFLAVGDPANDKLSIQFDMWKENWRTWQMLGDQSSVPVIHMNDNPAGPNEMYVGRDGPAPADLADVPESEWVSIDMAFDAATDAWEYSVNYASGSGGGTFNGTSDAEIAGQFWFGGWAFQTTMSADPVPPGGEFDNVVYIDNFRMEVVPEPATMTLLGLAGLALLRRRR